MKIQFATAKNRKEYLRIQKEAFPKYGWKALYSIFLVY